MAVEAKEANPIEQAIQARLDTIEQEIDCLSRMAASAKDIALQRQYWELAGDMQAEARKLRDELNRISSQAATGERGPIFAGFLKVLTKGWLGPRSKGSRRSFDYTWRKERAMLRSG
jgi:hypothetical protein